jgi:hypothetical protein
MLFPYSKVWFNTGAVKEVQKQLVLGYRQGGFLVLLPGGTRELGVFPQCNVYPDSFPCLSNAAGKAIP